MKVELEIIGVLHTPFKEKFGIPRQSGLAPAAEGELELYEPYDDPAALEGIEDASHLWVSYLFHGHKAAWKPRVRPPRLGGNEYRGVFATRSPYRPNSLGLSVVRLLGRRANRLHLGGLDMLDQTPVLDVKPYLPYSDRVEEANFRLAPKAPERLPVIFSEEARESCTRLGEQYLQLVEEVLGLDPRPAYQDDAERIYGTRLEDFDVRFRVEDGRVLVVALEELSGALGGDAYGEVGEVE